jgi:hypothetical protein
MLSAISMPTKPRPGCCLPAQEDEGFFEALGNALRGFGYQTAEDIFGKIELGELKATIEEPSKNKTQR